MRLVHFSFVRIYAALEFFFFPQVTICCRSRNISFARFLFLLAEKLVIRFTFSFFSVLLLLLLLLPFDVRIVSHPVSTSIFRAGPIFVLRSHSFRHFKQPLASLVHSTMHCSTVLISRGLFSSRFFLAEKLSPNACVSVCVSARAFSRCMYRDQFL